MEKNQIQIERGHSNLSFKVLFNAEDYYITLDINAGDYYITLDINKRSLVNKRIVTES